MDLEYLKGCQRGWPHEPFEWKEKLPFHSKTDEKYTQSNSNVDY